MGKKSRRNRSSRDSSKSEQKSGGGALAGGGACGGSRSRGTGSMTLKQAQAVYDKLRRCYEICDQNGMTKMEFLAVLAAETFKRSTLPYFVPINIYYSLGKAFLGVSNLTKSFSYSKKAFDMIEENGNSGRETEHEMFVDSMCAIVICCHNEEDPILHDEARAIVDRFMSFSARNNHDFLDLVPSLPVRRLIAAVSDNHKLWSLVYPILCPLLDEGIFDKQWTRSQQVMAYESLAKGYAISGKYQKAVSYLDRAAFIADSPETKVSALIKSAKISLEDYYDTKKSLETFKQAEQILSDENRSSSKFDAKRAHSFVHDCLTVKLGIGNALCQRKGNYAKLALKYFTDARELLENTQNINLNELWGQSVYNSLGAVYGTLEQWDAAHHNLSIAISLFSSQSSDDRKGEVKKWMLVDTLLNRAMTRLDQYCADNRLRSDTKKRALILSEVLGDLQSLHPTDGELVADSHLVFLLLAQAQYFQGILLSNSHDQKEGCTNLRRYVELVRREEGRCCRICRRKETKACVGCEAVDYCCKDHQRIEWKTGRLNHMVMCPFFKRWRVVLNAKNNVKTEAFDDISKEFFETVCACAYESED